MKFQPMGFFDLHNFHISGTNSVDISENNNNFALIFSDKRLVLAESVRPAFTAYLDQTLDNLGEGQKIVYNRVLLNDGNAYNNGSGKYESCR